MLEVYPAILQRQFDLPEAIVLNFCHGNEICPQKKLGGCQQSTSVHHVFGWGQPRLSNRGTARPECGLHMGLTPQNQELAVLCCILWSSECRVVTDVWEKHVWDFQAKAGSSGSCRLFLHFPGKIAVQKMSGKTPGSPRDPSTRHPRPT